MKVIADCYAREAIYLETKDNVLFERIFKERQNNNEKMVSEIHPQEENTAYKLMLEEQRKVFAAKNGRQIH